MPTKGRPHISFRIEQEKIDALKQHAKEIGLTYGDILRKLTNDYMNDQGIIPVNKPIDGQISTDDLDV